MKRFADISLKNKFFFSIMAVILIISITIGFLARWMLISTLSSELELRGLALASSIADSSSGYILDKNYPSLLSLIFDVQQVSERKDLIAYIFITDPENKVISHTFTHPFPEKLRLANPIPAGQNKSVKLLRIDEKTAYDIALPIKEGIYRIGTVHAGLNKNHIDILMDQLRFVFVGFILLIIVIVFIISHKLALYITGPIAKLIRISNEFSRGNFDIQLDNIIDGWKPMDCPAYGNPDLPCKLIEESENLSDNPSGQTSKNLRACQQCLFFGRRKGDEVVQLANSFQNMIWRIKPYPRQLRETEEKYRSLFDSGPDPIFVVDRSSLEIVDANPRAFELYGYLREDLIGKSILDLGPKTNKDYLTYFQEDKDAQGCVYYPKVLQYKEGEKPFFVNVHACAISYKEKPAIIIEATDITDLIEKDAQLIQASKMKSLGEMSAGIAHEINQPLNAIKLGSEFLEMMATENLDVPKDKFLRVINEISNQVDRAADIINTLRAFGRKDSLIKDKLDLNKPIRGAVSTVGKQFELQNISFKLDLSEQISPILGYDNRLQQVFLNLITNARDAIIKKNKKEGHTGERGVITIKTYQYGKKVFAEVRDNGIGIPKSVISKIFEPFFTTKEAGQGMGLGLAITYGIVKDHDGGIKIFSKEGEGTTFTLSFSAAA